jgi:hypothetical protein
MAKKILMALAAVLVVAGGVAALSAFEAHVINVTAHIENALTVGTSSLTFGTVFPQEYLHEDFNVALSQSFLDQNRMNDVHYNIEPKVKCVTLTGEHPQCVVGADTNNPTACACPAGSTPMLDLCRFLSVMHKAGSGGNDTDRPSYYTDGATPSCATPSPAIASGILNKLAENTTDGWKVDLKVPPVTGNVGQDWPVSCASYVVPTNGADYGCDLWIEVTGFSQIPT